MSYTKNPTISRWKTISPKGKKLKKLHTGLGSPSKKSNLLSLLKKRLCKSPITKGSPRLKKNKKSHRSRSRVHKSSHHSKRERAPSRIVRSRSINSKKGKNKICNECEDESYKIYCGRKCKLPQGYTRHGTSYECLQKGIYVGKYMDTTIE